MVMLVGVQSNQFPRALDLAKAFRAKNIKTAIGGFHVSGTMAMLKERDAHVQEALDIGVTLFAGEAEGRLGQVLIDAAKINFPKFTILWTICRTSKMSQRRFFRRKEFI